MQFSQRILPLICDLQSLLKISEGSVGHATSSITTTNLLKRLHEQSAGLLTLSIATIIFHFLICFYRQIILLQFQQNIRLCFQNTVKNGLTMLPNPSLPELHYSCVKVINNLQKSLFLLDSMVFYFFGEDSCCCYCFICIFGF